MTNAIETTKREMYRQIERMKYNADILALPPLAEMLGLFETAHEAHLEQLRQQYEQMAATARERFETIQSLEQANHELAEKLQYSSSPLGNQAETIYALRNKCDNLTEERDAIRNKLQAFEFANKSAGEFLIDALRKVKSQRKTIKALRKAQEARESEGATSAPSCEEIDCNGYHDLPERPSMNSFQSIVGVVYVTTQKYDEFTRTTCTACNRVTDKHHDQA